MTYSPVIRDWPTALVPMAQMFTGGSQPVAGGMTLGGAVVDNPEPGGRAVLTMDFAPFRRAANIPASWAATMLQAGAIFRIPITATVQLLSANEIFGDAADLYQSSTDPFTGETVLRWDPFVPITTAASKGAATFLADFEELGQVLLPGHVVGFTFTDYHVAHKVVSVSYGVDDEATIGVFPPLRRALTTDTKLRLRPLMTATCQGHESVIGSYRLGQIMQFGAARFVETIL